ncbi:MAG TPA: formate/nitrite transporter family protein [Acetobacteraceae bacterium]|nr:formate/nitrite transporter family protein [Acetobacteraceae bacterium]
MTGEAQGLTREEREEVRELSAPRAPVIYEVVRRQGEDELRRPVGSLFWSGLAGGITIMASVIAEGALAMKLPASIAWRQPVIDLGYSLGFLMVILGRMQLFTEQTIVAVLPIVANPGWRKLVITARLWVVVFLANMLGAALAGAMNVYGKLMGDDLLRAMLQVSHRLAAKTPHEILLTGIPGGFLIASVAWLRAGVTGGEFWIVLALTSAIALGNFTHVIAGSAETFLLLFAGQVDVARALGGMILPALGGNIIGGTCLFALLAHAQVRQEL